MPFTDLSVTATKISGKQHALTVWLIFWSNTPTEPTEYKSITSNLAQEEKHFVDQMRLGGPGVYSKHAL